METRDSYWIPAGIDLQNQKITPLETDFIMKGIQREKGQVNEDLLKESLDFYKQVLSPASEMARVKTGSFWMGNTRDDEEGDEREKFVHTVRLTYDYWIGRYPVTFWEYDSFCTHTNKDHPKDQGWGRGARPVIYVSWWDAIAFCNWLSQREGLAVAYRLIGEPDEGSLMDARGDVTEDITQVEGYRLPTEAEWEYAARGGHKSTEDYKYAGSDNIDEVAWCEEENLGSMTKGMTQPVGQKKPNELGLYDMSGNVWEWCHNWWEVYTSTSQTNPIGPPSGLYRVIRGGDNYFLAQNSRVASRNDNPPRDSWSGLGFRLVRMVY